MDFEPHTVLIEVVQRVAGRDGHAADIGEVVDHHLQDLRLDRLVRGGGEMAEAVHRVSGSVNETGRRFKGHAPAAPSYLAGREGAQLLAAMN